MTLPFSWSEAGLIDDEGNLDRPLPPDEWQVPSLVWLEDEKIVWSYGPLGPKLRKPRRGLMEGFIQLSEAETSDEKIAEFASQWGVLGICEHGLPATHNPPPIPAPQGAIHAWCTHLGRYSEESYLGECDGWEPIAAWRHFASQFRALLNLAGELHRGEPGKAEDWQLAYGSRKTVRGTGSVGQGQTVVSLFVERLLVMTGVRPHFSWRTGKPAMKLGAGGLFGALAVQLALAISRTDGIAWCASCGSPFHPTRMPRDGHRSYCQRKKCKKAALRDAKRDQRARERVARSS